MWFKNAQLYKLPSDWNMSLTDLRNALEDKPLRPCGAQEMTTKGWQPPAANAGVVVASNECYLLCLGVQERLLPAAVVKEVLAEKVEEFEAQQGYKPGRKQQQEMRTEIEFELMPKAFTRTRQTYGYIDTKHNIAIIDSSAAKRAEDFLTTLRETLGSFPAKPMEVASAPASLMTAWLKKGELPAGWELGLDTELRAADGDGVLRGRNVDLVEAFAEHLNAGAQVIKLALIWRERMSLVLAEDFSFKRIKFLDVLQDKLEEEVDGGTLQAEAALALMGEEMRDVIKELMTQLGGE